jgi:hypothetical protein
MKHPARKERLTVTVDAGLVAAANEAVRSGRAESLSGWVNLALTERAVKELRLRALAEAVAAHEKEFGTISDAEMGAQRRADQHGALVVRGPPRAKRSRERKRRRAA